MPANMPKKEILRLIRGFKHFREKFYVSGEDSTYSSHLADGQSPKTLIIACSDSRVDPAILSGAGPGDLFVVRNVANLVPPYETGGGRHGTSAAIEFAVVNLKVENIIVLGHRQCGGMRALLWPEEVMQPEGFLFKWVKVAEEAKFRAIKKVGIEDTTLLWRCCEMESLKTSLQNLRTFPFVVEAEKNRGLALHGIYFDIEKGELHELNDQDGEFHAINI